MSGEDVKFVKYTAHGNCFVIVDELKAPVVPEEEKGDLAKQMLDVAFGVGADNVIYLQQPNAQTYEDIARVRRYWSFDSLAIPETENSTAVFRLFEPEGSEALVCGNGMRSAVAYLARKYGSRTVDFVTEIPSRRPVILRGLTLEAPNGRTARSRVEISAPQAPQPEFVAPSILEPVPGRDDIQEVRDTAPYLGGTSGRIFATHTGEPYLIFPSSDTTEIREWRRGRWFERLGVALNADIQAFPAGINVIACRLATGRLEFRVFERLKNRETWASGSGAVATVAACSAAGLIPLGAQTEVWTVSPYADNDGPIRVSPQPSGNWLIDGDVRSICSGHYHAAE